MNEDICRFMGDADCHPCSVVTMSIEWANPGSGGY
jgi:hypothetical protein